MRFWIYFFFLLKIICQFNLLFFFCYFMNDNFFNYNVLFDVFGIELVYV